MDDSFMYLCNKNLIKKPNKYEDLFVSFYNKSYKVKRPYVGEVFSINIKKGFIEFNGHYYIDKKSLPVKMHMNVRDDNENSIEYLVILYKKKELEDTSKSFYDEDAGGNICLCPTNRIKLLFKIIKVISWKKNGMKGFFRKKRKIFN
jgi:hypothetical protein